jgi:hypothetical protein
VQKRPGGLCTEIRPFFGLSSPLSQIMTLVCINLFLRGDWLEMQIHSMASLAGNIIESPRKVLSGHKLRALSPPPKYTDPSLWPSPTPISPSFVGMFSFASAQFQNWRVYLCSLRVNCCALKAFQTRHRPVFLPSGCSRQRKLSSGVSRR